MSSVVHRSHSHSTIDLVSCLFCHEFSSSQISFLFLCLADQSQTETSLDAADISLIPLQEEGETEHQENEEEMVDNSIVHEAITLAHELGLRCGQAAAAAAAMDGRQDEDMDLEVFL